MLTLPLDKNLGIRSFSLNAYSFLKIVIGSGNICPLLLLVGLTIQFRSFNLLFNLRHMKDKMNFVVARSSL